jgi:hypothetical protein
VNQRPNQGSWLRDRAVIFAWNVTHSDGVTETRLEVATDPDFKNIVLSKSLPGASTSYAATFNQDYKHLYWRVALSSACFPPQASATYYFGIDTSAPVSQVNLVNLLENGRLALGWRGTDPTSGIAHYTVQYKPEGGANWLTLLSDYAGKGTSFLPEVGKRYLFRSLATDVAGNAEQKSAGVFDISSDEAIPVYRAIMLPQIHHGTD